MRCIAFVFVALSCLSTVAIAATDEDQKAREAVRVLDEIMQAPDRRVPDSLLHDAEAVAVIPDVIKAGLVVGGRHGRGLLSVRGRDGTWSNPTFLSITGGSVGFQAGVQSTDVVLVFRTRMKRDPRTRSYCRSSFPFPG